MTLCSITAYSKAPKILIFIYIYQFTVMVMVMVMSWLDIWNAGEVADIFDGFD